MKGPACVGRKQTCTEKIGDKLSAAFFSRSNGRDDHKRFFTTFAYQLAAHNTEYHAITPFWTARFVEMKR
jgi:hypothetical protein